MSGYKILTEELPAVRDGRKLRRIAAVDADDGFDDTVAHAFESSDGTWSVGLGLLTEQGIDMFDLRPLLADSEQTARRWIEAIARAMTR